MSQTLSLPGGCNCGAVRYRVTRAPLTAYICHCHLCQKRTGSAFSLSVVIPEGGFEIVVGQPRRTGSAFSLSVVIPEGGFEIVVGLPRRTERRLADGTVNFSLMCEACFSRILTGREGRPSVNLRAGTLDDTNWIRPVAQVWTSSAQPWAIIRADVLTYAEQPKDFGELLAAWKSSGAGPPAG